MIQLKPHKAKRSGLPVDQQEQQVQAEEEKQRTAERRDAEVASESLGSRSCNVLGSSCRDHPIMFDGAVHSSEITFALSLALVFVSQ